MSEFLDILTHGRRLQGAVKDLTINELELVVEKLTGIIEKRKSKELEQQKAAEEKLAKLQEIKKQMEEAGLNFDDLQTLGEDKPKRKSSKRAIKYRLTDDNGEQHNWTGVGRMPLVFKAALEAGKSLEDFTI